MSNVKRIRSNVLMAVVCLFIWALFLGRSGRNRVEPESKHVAELQKVADNVELNDPKSEDVNPPISATKPATPKTSSTIASEYRCRHRNSKYAGAPKFSPKLQHIIKRYNRLHDKLLQELPADHSLKVPLTSRNNTVRYVFLRHQQDADLATQLYTLLSTYLLAILTDRVLIVDNEEYERVMCEPFTRSSWFAKTKLFNAAGIPKDIDKALSTRRPIRALQLDLLEQSTRAALQCSGNLKETLSHVQWLLIDDNVGQFVSVLLANTAHDQHLWEVFPNGSVIAPLYHALIHPSNQIWQDIPELLKAFADSAIEKPTKVSLVTDDSLNPITQRVAQELTDQVVNATDESHTVALLISPSDNDIVNEAVNVYTPPSYLVACSAAHFYGDTSQDRYGRLFADLHLSMHADLLLFGEGSVLGWLSHAIRTRPSFMITGDTFVDVPPVDFAGQPAVTCESQT